MPNSKWKLYYIITRNWREQNILQNIYIIMQILTGTVMKYITFRWTAKRDIFSQGIIFSRSAQFGNKTRSLRTIQTEHKLHSFARFL